MKRFNLMLCVGALSVVFFACNQSPKGTDETVAVTEKNVTCRIWETESFYKLPDSVNVPGIIHFEGGVVDCRHDSGNFIGVWVTFHGKDVSELNLTSHLNNVSLVRKNTNEVLHPVAYMAHSNLHGDKDELPEYMNNKSEFRKCKFILTPNEKYDLFILFEAAEVGDKLIIEDFLEVEIE